MSIDRITVFIIGCVFAGLTWVGGWIVYKDNEHDKGFDIFDDIWIPLSFILIVILAISIYYFFIKSPGRNHQALPGADPTQQVGGKRRKCRFKRKFR